MTVRELFAVGKIVKPFGVRGEIVVQIMTPDARRFKKLSHVFIGIDAGSAASQTLENARIEGKGVRLKLTGIDDRNAAEALVGRLVFVDEKDRIRVPKGTWFVHDIIGAAVVDEQKGEIGTVSEILKLPAHDVYVVLHNGREIMIPAVKEFITKVDVAARKITVRLIDGMLEA